MRSAVIVAVSILALLPPGLREGGSSGSESAESADAGTTEDAGEADASGENAPGDLAATQFAALLGKSWSGRSGCQGGWKGVWRVAGGRFSLVSGSTEGAGGAAFHAVCESYRPIGGYAGSKVTVTLLDGVIHQVAVLAGGGSAKQKSELVSYFSKACDEKRSQKGRPYDTVYAGCGGYDVGLAEGESDVSLYFFSDQSAFRSRMNSLPMPTKPDN